MHFGASISVKVNNAEVTNISPFGIWILASDGNEYFAPYSDYPVFETASIKDIAAVQTDCLGNLHWPALDADIELEALRRPHEFPMQYS